MPNRCLDLHCGAAPTMTLCLLFLLGISSALSIFHRGTKVDLLHGQSLVKRKVGAWKRRLVFSEEVRIQLELKFRCTGRDF